MKRSFTLLFCLSILLASCSREGPQGPPGPPGPPGDGIDGLGYTLEQTVDFEYFSNNNLYSAIVLIPDDVATINPEADAVLVYRLEIVQDDNGNDIDAWSLIPQNFFLEEGIIQYVYNHTINDVELIIDGDFDLVNLDESFVMGQTFRIVVVPSDYLNYDNVEIANINAVMEAFNIDETEIKKSGRIQN